ncbi:hypothetical protein VTK73DRAFT_3528 [Phialemonium thermophilum]|uniref:Uncharacterized protein n=1 Tax=Phialemonium thermophilum TaxID=223376 RepID=A0ABR3XZL5_9PEZI
MSRAFNYAFGCLPDWEPQPGDRVYAAMRQNDDGSVLPFIGNGNLDFYYDLRMTPKEEDKIPTWQKFTVDMPQGHLKTAWVWVSREESAA